MDGLNFFCTGSSAVGSALGSGLRCRGFKSRLPEACTEDALRPTGFEAEQLCCEAGPRPERPWEIPPTRILYRCSPASRTASDGFWQRAEGEFQAFEAEQLCCEAGPRPERPWEIPPTRILCRCSPASRTASVRVLVKIK